MGRDGSEAPDHHRLDRGQGMTTTKLSFLRRLPQLTVKDFSSYWRGPHVKALVEEGGHREYNKTYVQNLVTECRLGSDALVFDGIAQMEVREDLPSTRRFQEDPRYLRCVRPDEDKFLDVGECAVLYCETTVIAAPPSEAHLKLMLLHAHAATSPLGGGLELSRQLLEQAPMGIKQHDIDSARVTRMSDGSLLQWPFAAITELTVDTGDRSRQVLDGVREWHITRRGSTGLTSMPAYLAAFERLIY